ncbi:MAG: hypothetical protein NTW19_16935 [Planctomycetota bacterium]|nr:hypothetical protein [Planctomycetota bacterium]
MFTRNGRAKSRLVVMFWARWGFLPSSRLWVGRGAAVAAALSLAVWLIAAAAAPAAGDPPPAKPDAKSAAKNDAKTEAKPAAKPDAVKSDGAKSSATKPAFPKTPAVADDKPVQDLPPGVVLPMDRTAYFTGETVPLAFRGYTGEIKLEAVGSGAGASGRVTLHQGAPVPIWLSTAALAPGDYALEVDGKPALDRLTIVSPIRSSLASLQDEAIPNGPPNPAGKIKPPPEEIAQQQRAYNDKLHNTLKEIGLTAGIALGAAEPGRNPVFDTLARSGMMGMFNTDTRPTSFCPPMPRDDEVYGISQRMILVSQANGRHPNFGGICMAWDSGGYAQGNRRTLLIYWNWNKNAPKLRTYIDATDKFLRDDFKARSGLEAVSEEEYLSYLLSIGRTEFATVIDLPTKVWTEEIAKHTKPMPAADREQFERRLDAWSWYLMNIYGRVYGAFEKNLKAVDGSMRHTGSIQIDHADVRRGQYLPTAYAPLDFRYQSTWNDQFAAPDYDYQWLFTAAMLDMERPAGQPVWISNTTAGTHGKCAYPGKVMRVAAHDLAYGGSGVGFAYEGFSTIMGGLNHGRGWEVLKNDGGAADVISGRDFLRRFAPLALDGKADAGVGVLFSRSQLARQTATIAFGRPYFMALVSLARLGYTPRFITEEDIAAGRADGLKGLVVIGQTVPLPEPVLKGIEAMAARGAVVAVDASSTTPIPGSRKLDFDFPVLFPGKPQNWSAPNTVPGDDAALIFARNHAKLAPALLAAFGEAGRAALRSEAGADALVSLSQIDAGADAKFVVAVNDSCIRNQADWHEVREKLVPTAAATGLNFAYDCSDEKPLGKLGPIEADLSRLTARVYALTARPLTTVGLAATQRVRAGEAIAVSVSFADEAGATLRAVLPFELRLLAPDGKESMKLQRGTTRDGLFSIALPLGANAPAGKWKVEARSSLTGQVASIPVQVDAGQAAAMATPIAEPVVVREPAAIKQALTKGAKVFLPVYEGHDSTMMKDLAFKLRDRLAAKGVTVELIHPAEMTTYTIGYTVTDEAQDQNNRVDRGETLASIFLDTQFHNDWASGMSGYRSAKPVILLDLAGSKSNPIVQRLNGAGLLWPQVSDQFPGRGRAVVQFVHWAFGPGAGAIVVQANDVGGLEAGIEALDKPLPEDRITPGVRAAREALWTGLGVGGRPAMPKADGLTSDGLAKRVAPEPLAIQFGSSLPPRAEDVVKPVFPQKSPTTLPAVFDDWKQWTIQIRDGDTLIDSGTIGFLHADLRFHQALRLAVKVDHAGKLPVAVTGSFRYSNAKPCWQAQWEDIINLRQRIMPTERQPMEIEVLIDGKPAGKLLPSRTEQREIPLEMHASSAGAKPLTQEEEIVVELRGEIDFPASAQNVQLIHHNIVDGRLVAIGVGLPAPPLPPDKKPEEKKPASPATTAPKK